MSTPNQNPNNQDNPKRPSFTQYLPLVLIALLITMVFNYVYSSMTSASMNEITYTEFLGMLNNGELDSVQIQSDRILILSKEEAEKPAAEQQIYYTALIPNLELTGLTQAMSAKDVDYSGKIVEKANPIVSFIVSWVLPIAIMYLLFSLLMRNMTKHMGGGGGIMGIGRAINYGFANNGILTIMSYYGPDVQLSQFIAYIIGICVAFFGGAALTYVVGFEDDPLPGSKAPKTAPKAVTAGDVELSAPVEGTVIPASDIKDEVFASGALGKGIGVIPTSGDVVAPADCTVELVYETKHALGLNVNGVEVLLHIGVNTVDLQGKYFETFVENGQKVKKGQKLVHFDLDALKKAGYDTTVAMLVSNADDLGGVAVATEGPAVISVVR